MKKRSIIVAMFCLLVLCGCSSAEQSTNATETTTTTKQATTVSETETTTTQQTAAEPETTTEQAKSQEEIILPLITTSQEQLFQELMTGLNLCEEDLILEKPEDMNIADYLMFMRYMKVNQISKGYFSKSIEEPSSSACFIPNFKFYEDYPGTIYTIDRDVYSLTTLESVKDISEKRYEELSTIKELEWCASQKVDDELYFWLGKEDFFKNNPGLTEDGKEFIIAWPEEWWTKYVDYWLICDE